MRIRRAWTDLLTAMQFLTRIPVPAHPYEPDALARSVGYFPLVGALVGCGAALLHLALAPHLPRLAASFLVLISLVVVTGGLHEDGLADAADGFGGGSDREKILTIFRDSRIGSYGAAALTFSLVGRLLLISSIPLALVPFYLIGANALCRWTVLPLSYFLPSARAAGSSGMDGQGARIARSISTSALVCGTVLAFVLAGFMLKGRAIAPLVGVMLVSWLTGAYYKRRIQGVTGDCFGATIQMAEASVYLCGAWIL